MEKYRSLEAWKRAHASLIVVLRTTDAAYHPRSRALFDQLKRAAISIEANIVEGYALGTPNYFKRHLRIAIGSAAEAECLARAAEEVGYLDKSAAGSMLVELGAAMKLIRGLLFKPLAFKAPSARTAHPVPLRRPSP